MSHLLLQRYTELKGKTKTAAVQHLIFGLDDILIDVEKAELEAFQGALRTEGQKDITEPEHHALFSKEVTVEERFRKFLGIKQANEATADENALIGRLCKQKEDKKHEIIHQQFLDGQIKAIPGAIDLIRKLHAKGIKLAITSENTFAADILYNLGMLDQFEVCMQRRKDEISGKYHYVTMNTKAKIAIPEKQKTLPAELFTPCNVQFDGDPWPWRYFDTARRMGANPFNCGVVTSNPHINHENIELGFGGCIFADTTRSYDKKKTRSGTACLGDTKESVIAQLSAKLLDEKVLSDSPTLSPKTDFYSAIQASVATEASTKSPESIVPCVKLNRYTTGKNPETANIKYFLWDVEGCIIDSVGAQIKSFRKAILQVHEKYLSKITSLLKELDADEEPAKEQISLLQQQIDILSKLAEKLRYLTDDDYHKLISGRSRDGGFRNLLGIPREADSSPAENALINALCEEKDKIFQDMLMSGKVKAFPAVVTMLKELHAKGIKMAFASGSSNAAMMLYKAGILNLFEVGVQKGRDKASGQEGKYVTMPNTKFQLTPEETEIPAKYFNKCDVEFHGKPMPWIFYKAAHKMGANPFECVVIEDSPQIAYQYFEAGFGAVIGLDTGNAFDPKLVLAGNVYYCEKDKNAEDVANKGSKDILSRVTTTTAAPSMDTYAPVHAGHSYHPSFFGSNSSSSSSIPANQATVGGSTHLLPTGTDGASPSLHFNK